MTIEMRIFALILLFVCTAVPAQAAILPDTELGGCFPVEQRVDMLKRACGSIPNVQVISYGGLLAQGYSRAKECIACGQCEGVCPQHLPVIDLIRSASEKLDDR